MTYPELLINTDGGSRGNPGQAAIGVVAKTPEGNVIFELSDRLGITTNNVAEYSAVIHALDYLVDHQLEVNKITFVLDSELIVRQITGQYRVKESHLLELNQDVKQKIQTLRQTKNLKSVSFKNVLRGDNKRADTLVNQALDSQK